MTETLASVQGGRKSVKVVGQIGWLPQQLVLRQEDLMGIYTLKGFCFCDTISERKEPLIMCVETPRLKNVSKKHFIIYNRLRNRFKKKILENLVKERMLLKVYICIRLKTEI